MLTITLDNHSNVITNVDAVTYINTCNDANELTAILNDLEDTLNWTLDAKQDQTVCMLISTVISRLHVVEPIIPFYDKTFVMPRNVDDRIERPY